jgi:hypothetical protein
MAKNWIELRNPIVREHHAILEESRTELINPEILDQFRSKPVIFVSFHLGTYYYVPTELVYIGFEFSTVVSRDVAEEMGKIFEQMSKSLGSNFELIIAAY